MGPSLSELMDELVALEQTIVADGEPALRVYRWTPYSAPELPAVWNWLLPSPGGQVDVSGVRWEDTFNIAVRLGIRHTDVNEEMARLEKYADAFVEAIDLALSGNFRGTPVLGGTAQQAKRLDVRMADWPFNQVRVLGIEARLECRVDRVLPVLPS